MGQLSEIQINYYIYENYAPVFLTTLTTNFSINLFQVFIYTLPEFSDPDTTDYNKGILKIQRFGNNSFPSFITYYSDARSLVMNPKDNDQVGKTFYFNVVLKESQTSTINNAYKISVKILKLVIPSNFLMDISPAVGYAYTTTFKISVTKNNENKCRVGYTQRGLHVELRTEHAHSR